MLRSPHGLAGVVGLAVLAQHHLGLVLQGLYVLRILQSPRLWGEAAPVSLAQVYSCYKAGHEVVAQGSGCRHGRGAPWAGPCRGRGSHQGLRPGLSAGLHAVQADLGCASGLALVLHGWEGRKGQNDTPASPAAHLLSRPPGPAPCLTVLVHARLQALLQPAGLALVAMRLVHRAHPCPHLAPAGEDETPGVSVPPRS